MAKMPITVEVKDAELYLDEEATTKGISLAVENYLDENSANGWESLIKEIFHKTFRDLLTLKDKEDAPDWLYDMFKSIMWETVDAVKEEIYYEIDEFLNKKIDERLRTNKK